VPLSESAGWERDVAQPRAEREVAPAPVRDRSRKLPEHVADDLQTMLGSRRGGRVAQVLAEAAKAFERDRFSETMRLLRPLIDEAPDAAAVRELYGLACYREGKWAEAVRHLTAFTEMSGSVEQHPVLADAHRALKHFAEVSVLWEELSQSSPSAQLVAEGRIVMAGSLADQGKLTEAIGLMERGAIDAKRPKDHHLRLWYALADLYERAGDTPRARDRFQRIMVIDSNYANVAERVANLG
jgi:tetratricopeptide (TPR) repeat protein